MTKIVQTSLKVRKEPLKSSFSTSLRSVNELTIIEFHIRTDDGHEVFGETVETPAITGDSIEEIQLDLNRSLSSAICNKPFTHAGIFFNSHVFNIAATNSAKAAVDIALYELDAAITGRDLNAVFGASVVNLATDVTVPLSNLDQIPSLLAARTDFSTFKVKLASQSLDTNIAKVTLIRELIGPDAHIRIDPNQSWSVDESVEFLREIEKRSIRIEYLEQPVKGGDKAGLARVRKSAETKIMADESIYTIADLEELVALEAVDLINVKTIKSGGVTPALAIIERATELGIDYSIGTMMEGDKGVKAAFLIAAAHRPDYCHDLDAAWWAVTSSLTYAAGKVSI